MLKGFFKLPSIRKKVMKIKYNKIFEKKWVILIIKTLLQKDKNFSSIKREISGISDKVLSQRLMEMEKADILKRYVYTGIPVRVEYGLTMKGRDLRKVIYELSLWMDAYVK